MTTKKNILPTKKVLENQFSEAEKQKPYFWQCRHTVVLKSHIFCMWPNIGPYDRTTYQKVVYSLPKLYTWQHCHHEILTMQAVSRTLFNVESLSHTLSTHFELIYTNMYHTGPSEGAVSGYTLRLKIYVANIIQGILNFYENFFWLHWRFPLKFSFLQIYKKFH